LAVDALAVITWAWSRAVQSLPGPPSDRRYVDDLTAWAAGTPAEVTASAGAVWQATEEFATAFQLDLNRQKSALFGHPPAARKAMRAAVPGVPVVASFRDLGVTQAFVRQGASAGGTARLLAAEGRFRRLGGLPLPFLQRVRATASAGVSAACWGAVVYAPPASHIARLRTWAGRAIWRSGRYGAVELRLLLSGPDGRADPAAQFAFALSRRFGCWPGRCGAAR